MRDSRVRIRGGRIIDPSQAMDVEADLLIVGGRIHGLARPGKACRGERVVDARGCVVAPGFVDLHCHLGDPEGEDVESLATGTAAAAAGGFTTICCMPDTLPPLDHATAIEAVKARARDQASVRVLPLGTVTRGREGVELAEMAEMAWAGAVAFTDDGNPITSSRLLRHALEYSLLANRPIVDHAEDAELARGGQMHDGEVATVLGLRGVPAEAEEITVARDLALAKLTGARLHLAHLSTAGGVDLVRRAKAQGVRVTAEVSPHHLTLTERAVAGTENGLACYNTLAKVSPPLRTQSDVAALRSAVRDGTIDAVATDHIPRRFQDKACEFGLARFGISGLETALGLVLGVVTAGDLTLHQAVAALTCGPARAFDLPYGTLSPGAAADVVVFDPHQRWIVTTDRFRSRGRNNPLEGQPLVGRVRVTLVGGQIVFEEEAQ